MFKSLENSCFEFLTNYKFTNDIYKIEEKIECTFLINVTKAITSSQFEASIQVQCRRPVFNTSYGSTLMNFNDKDFIFSYAEMQAMEFNENTFTNNLTCVLAYYAYIILGLDYDSYALEGGTPYFQKALNVVNNAQNTSEPGWKAFDDNKSNRYWLIENILNSNYKPVRACYYKYHRLGMDIFHMNMEGGRKVISDAIEDLRKVHDIIPNSFFMRFFFNTKVDEIVSIYQQAPTDIKTKMVATLTVIAPANTNKWPKIMEGK